MILNNRLTRLFGIDYPILQAPMAGASNPDLVAAVSNAGGLGALGAAAMSPDSIRKAIHAIRQQTDKPFNVNLFSASIERFDRSSVPGPEYVKLMTRYHEQFALGPLPAPTGLFDPMQEQLAVLIAERVPVISLHFGVDPAVVAKIKQAGLMVICSATTAAEARTLQAAGVDAVIAQGAEAGGHRGTFAVDYTTALIGTLALVPAIVDSVTIPVIAAGGIMDARGILASLVLGAEGVSMGTAFLACPETGLNAAWKAKLLGSEADATTITTAISGKPARGIRNRYIDEVEALQEALLPYPMQYAMSGPLRSDAAQRDDPEFLAMWSGQGVGLIKEQPAAELIATWLSDLDRLSVLVSAAESNPGSA